MRSNRALCAASTTTRRRFLNSKAPRLVELRRVLKPSGYFIFDTPNRAVTEIQQRGLPARFINDDHKYEYKHAELVEMLERHNFAIDEAKGLTWTPSARQSGTLDLMDMVRHFGFFDDLENCYLLYYRCRPKK